MFDFGRADLHFGSHSHGSLGRNGWDQRAKSEPMRHSEKKTTSSQEKQKSSFETKCDAFNICMFNDLTIHV